MRKLEFTCIGTHWERSGDLFLVTHPDGRQARVYVDDIGETWVDIRRIPDAPNKYFYSERVEAYRSYKLEGEIYADLRKDGFGNRTISPYAGRVRQRPI